MLRRFVQILSSMRFAVILLAVICVASVFGTVIKQNEPYNNYINQFGPTWAKVMDSLGLFSVYSSPWFLGILFFLMLSTSLCLWRNIPRILVDLRQFKEHLQIKSLDSFSFKSEWKTPIEAKAFAHQVVNRLRQNGWHVKVQPRTQADGSPLGWMVAARIGRSHKIGYIAAHSAIILICLGGLIDGDVMIKAQMWWGNKTPYEGGGLIADVPAKHRLSSENLSYRGNMLVPEGAKTNVAMLTQGDGVVLQDLPFAIELKKFIVEYYPTGMPKLFASDIVIHDDSGATRTARVEVNHPVEHRGVQIYQSGFDDGGSKVKLTGYVLGQLKQSIDPRPQTPWVIASEVGGQVPLVQKNTLSSTSSSTSDETRMTLEVGALRVINVENFANNADNPENPEKQPNRFFETLEGHLGAANKSPTKKALRNIGPSITYKLRDAAGQATEYQNYMVPVPLSVLTGRTMAEGEPDLSVFLLGSREQQDQSFKYLRLPADGEQSLGDFLRLQRGLMNPQQRERAIQRYAQSAAPADKPELATALQESVRRAMSVFVGEIAPNGQPPTEADTIMINGEKRPVAGLMALSRYVEQRVPPHEQSRASEMIIRLVNGTLYEILQQARATEGLSLLPQHGLTQAFLAQSVLSLSDLGFYPAPMLFELQSFDHIQASVFQLTRSPGKFWVYLGSCCLMLGVFAMLYIRDRRLWVWITPTQTKIALSANRKTLAMDQQFQHLVTDLQKQA